VSVAPASAVPSARPAAGPGRLARARRHLRWAVPLVLTLYGGALRLEALVGRYWGDGAPVAVQRAAAAVQHLRPGAFTWTRETEGYGGDPYNYLRLGRSMERFYDADRREPVFVAATRAALTVTGGDDASVSLASAFFSTLTIPATYALGAAAFSPAVGAAAAFGQAVEWRVVHLSVEGWRDDTFAFFAVLSAWLLLRLRNRPSFGAAVASGIAGALACLTRLTSLSFLLPGYALVALARPFQRRRAEYAATSLAVMAGVVWPFLAACGLAFGDPLRAVNVHTGFYRARAGQERGFAMGWLDYLRSSRPPAEAADTLLRGLTEYPFASKWEGFEDWSPTLGDALPVMAVAGLAFWLTTPRGRFLAAILLTSLLPFAWTWDIRGGGEWRFTLHAYPFYLVAAWSVPWFVWRWRRAAARPPRQVVLAIAAIALALVAAFPLLFALRSREALAWGREVRVEAGWRGAVLFAGGWSRPVRQGNVTVRFARGTRATLRAWLPEARDHTITLRLDPFVFEGAPPQTVRVALNDAPVADLALSWNERRIGTYEVRLPAEHVRAGWNQISLDAAYAERPDEVTGTRQSPPGSGPVAFLLWAFTIAPEP
jgi:hypothetical protein